MKLRNNRFHDTRNSENIFDITESHLYSFFCPLAILFGVKLSQTPGAGSSRGREFERYQAENVN